MHQNVKSSVLFYQKGGNYPTWAINQTSTRLDNWSDSIMLLSAIQPVSSIAKDAMSIPYARYKGCSPTQSLINFMTAKKGSSVREYSRYWHGYLVIMKPLLFMLPLSCIRLLNMYAQLLLAFYLFSLFYNEFGFKYAFVFFLSYLILNPVSLILSFQYSTVFYISVLSVIILLKTLKTREKLRKYNTGYMFLFFGIITSFFDLLSYPLLSLSFPLLTLLLLLKKHVKTISINSVIEVLTVNSAFWGFGYVGMYFSKWVVASLITGNNLVLKGIGAAFSRMSSHLNNGQVVTVLDAIARINRVILKDPSLIVFLAGILAFVYLSYKMKDSIISDNTKALCVGFSSIAIFPFIWFSVFFNHTYVHFWFTYRNLAVTVFSLGCLFLILYEESQKDVSGISINIDEE